MFDSLLRYYICFLDRRITVTTYNPLIDTFVQIYMRSDSFEFLFLTYLSFMQAFLGFMKGKAPQTILTDHNMWLKEAIAVELPETKHGFCIWHILSKFSDWFSLFLGSQYDEWKAEFHRLYNLELVEDFEEGWRQMVDQYGLHANKHIISLYSLRTFWALPFLRRYFFAGLTSTCQSESINAFIQQFLSAQSQLDRFVEQVCKI